MSKPVSSSLKDWLVELVAKEMQIEESLCNKVVSWAYLQAKEATRNNRIIELSGFGKIQISPHKVKKRIEKIQNVINREDFPEDKKSVLKDRINMLKTKYLDNDVKLEGNTGGVEKRLISSERTEGDSEENTGGKAGNM